jgi:hypothetical protein
LTNQQNEYEKKLTMLKYKLWRFDYTKSDKVYQYRISYNSWVPSLDLINDTISEETNETLETEDTEQYMFLNSPFSPWETGIRVNGTPWIEFFENLNNTYLWLSFLINNINTTQQGMFSIIDDLSMYWDELDKVLSFQEFKNIWPFSPYYLNNWYVNPLRSDKIKFSIVKNTIDWQQASFWGWTDWSVSNIVFEMNSQILQQKFESLKTTYCWNKKEPSVKQNCINYMDYLKTLPPWMLRLELEYITTLQYMKEKWVKNSGKYFINETYASLWSKFPNGSSIQQDLYERWKRVTAYIWQCVWYIQKLKDVWRVWNWKQVFWTLMSQGNFAWDKINPRVETEDAILKKIQVWDIISFNWRNNQYGCNKKSWDPSLYWHVAVVIWKNDINKTIDVVEANVVWVMIVSTQTLKVKNMCDWWVVHDAPWRWVK